MFCQKIHAHGDGGPIRGSSVHIPGSEAPIDVSENLKDDLIVFGKWKWTSILVRASCVHCPWALHAEQSGLY